MMQERIFDFGTYKDGICPKFQQFRVEKYGMAFKLLTSALYAMTPVLLTKLAETSVSKRQLLKRIVPPDP